MRYSAVACGVSMLRVHGGTRSSRASGRSWHENGRPVPSGTDRPLVPVERQLTLIAVSSMTNDVCSELSSTPLNFNATLPVMPDSGMVTSV
jgi:hypothetical protein